jgi:succinate dehydrogenase/fumarate reductase flavoprotein subunit
MLMGNQHMRGFNKKINTFSQKRIVTEQALKRGAELINRVMCFDLITENKHTVGAVAINTREDEWSSSMRKQSSSQLEQ